MSTLTDRYVWAVLRAVPTAQREDLELEIRALIADAIDARHPNGDARPEAVERDALVELGDPSLLAARYADRPQHLIGPGLYPEWRRLLALLLPIVVPTATAIVFAANLMSDQTVGQAIAAATGAGVSVAVQTVFWLTLVFAVIERVGAPGASPTRPWSPDDLPELPDDGRLPRSEFIATIAANTLVAAGLLWVQLQPPTVIDGESFPLFDPALWSFWLPWFLGVVVAEILLAIVLFVRGGWTWPLAIVNAVLGAAFAIPAVYLLQNDMLFNPALVDKIREATGGGSWLEVTGVIIAVSVVAVAAWDALDGFRKARRASSPPLRRAAT